MFNLQSSRSADVNTTVQVPLDGTDGTGIGSPAQMGGQCVRHAISINPGDSTAGTITVLAKTIGRPTAEPVFIDVAGVDTPWVIDLSVSNEPLSREINGFQIEYFEFQAAGMDGATQFTPLIASGD